MESESTIIDALVDADDLLPVGGINPEVAAMIRGQPMFPMDALPGPVAGVVEAQCRLTGREPAPLAMTLLAACAGAIGNRQVIQVDAAWRESCALWVVQVAASGSMKTATMDPARDVLRAVEQAEQDAAAGDLGAKLPRLLVVGQPTTEVLAMLEQDNPGGLVVLRDEWPAFLSSMDAYRKGNGIDRGYYLEAMDGKPFQHDRKQSASAHVPHHLLSMFGAAQPKMLAAQFTEQNVASGLVPRICLVGAERRAYVPVRHASDDEQRKNAAMAALVACLQHVRLLRMFEGKRPHTVRCTPEAMDVLHEYGEETSGRAHMLDEGLEASMLEKQRGLAARLALVLSTLERAGEGSEPELLVLPVGVDHARRACRIAAWCAEENVRHYALLGIQGRPDDRRRALELAADTWKRCGSRPFTERDFQRCHRLKTAEAAKAMLCRCEPQWVARAEQQNPKGGRQRMLWQPAGWSG